MVRRPWSDVHAAIKELLEDALLLCCVPESEASAEVDPDKVTAAMLELWGRACTYALEWATVTPRDSNHWRVYCAASASRF